MSGNGDRTVTREGGAPEAHRLQPVAPALTPATSEGDLSILLQDEYFLSKILGFLVNDGLHECRRVCRKWRDTISLLPVTVKAPEIEDLPAVVSLFPRATSLTFDARPVLDWLDRLVQPGDVVDDATVDCLYQ